MKQYSDGAITYFVSDDIWRRVGEDPERIASYTRSTIGDDFFEGGVFWKAVCYFKKKMFPHIAILHAHGGNIDHAWVYEDGGKDELLQEWIDRYDAKYDCLGLFSCNPHSVTPKSRRALLVVPDQIVGGIDERGVQRECHFTLIHPKYGEIDRYVVDYYLRGGV